MHISAKMYFFTHFMDLLNKYDKLFSVIPCIKRNVIASNAAMSPVKYVTYQISSLTFGDKNVG